MMVLARRFRSRKKETVASASKRDDFRGLILKEKKLHVAMILWRNEKTLVEM